MATTSDREREARPDREARIVEWLGGLSDKRFAEVFYSAVQQRSGAGLADWRAHFVLGEAEKVGQEPWSLELIGPSCESVAEPDRVLAQVGRCARCRSSVRSWSRHATCPMCGRRVHCT